MPAGNGSSTGATASAAQLRNANSAQMQAAAAARLAALQAAGHQQQMQMQQQQLALQQQQQRLGIGLGNNRLGCSCGTVPRKGFRCDETPAELKQMGPQHSQQQHHPLQQPAHQASAHQHQSQHATRSMMAAVDAVSGQRKDAHILRLWAEVFHVSAAPNGGVRWQQMSDDLVPVNVRYMAEGVNRCSFHISAYNTMVDKVLDVRVPQPGTRLGQASECFVYWKDSSTNDTWGLNFTSPVDARTFRQLCSAPAPRATMPANGTAGGKGRAMKAGEAVGGRRPVTRGTKKKPQSTPSSPSARRSAFIEDQQHMQQLPCTCGPTVDQQQQQQPTQQPMARPRNTKIRYAAATSSTLPKCMFRQDGRLVAYPSTTNLMPSGAQKGQPGQTVPALVRSHTALGATSRPASSAAMSSSAAQHRTQYATRSAMSRSVESAQPSNVRQQLALAQQHQMCRLAACQARASELSPADARSRSKSTEDVRRSVATTTEDLTGQAAAVAGAGPTVAQTNGHVSRRMMATQALNQTGQVAPAQMTAQPIGAQVPIDSRTMTYRSATGSVCPMPNCGVPLQSYGQQPPPGMTMTNGMNGQMARNMIRPTSVPNWTLPSEDSIEADMRSRLYRSETGRRRSLERSACVDLTDQSPPSDKLILDSLRKAFVQQQQQQMHMQKVAQTQQQAQQANHLQQQMAAAAVAAVTPAMYRTATQLMSQTDASKSQTATHAVGRSVQITSDAKPSGPGRDTTGTAVPIERSPSPHDKSGKNGSTSNVATVAANNLSQFLTSRVLAATDKQQHSIGADGQRSSSPTVRLLHEYESQLRELLARGNSVELENSSLHSFEALLSQSMENVVSLMREVQSELDAIRREEQQIRARSESNSAANSLGPTRPHSSAGIRTSLASNAAALATASRSPWARSNTLPSRHSLGVNANGTASRSQPTLNDALGSTAYGLSTNVLHAPSADWTRSLRKRASAPYLFDQLTAPTAHDSLWAAQASFESNDSRAFLTSSELSDEDKLSMNTAMSDDEGDLAASARSALDSPKSGQPASGVIHCGGAIRKAGFLCVKKWLLRRPNGCSSSSANVGNGLSVELARRRGWRSYWVCLKGTTLLFYRSEQSAAELSHDPLLLTEDSIAPEQRPKHLLVVDGALVQPIPEHPKRDFVFCLSTVLGDAYLFQAPCQLELEHWTAEIHCACAAALSRHRGRSGTLHLLDETLNRLQRRLDTEAKLRHVAELQLSAQNDLENRRVAQSQLRSHEEALELCCVEQYRLRCYIASLLEREQPNPKTLLAHCSKGTKALLNRLGVFNVSSLHAFVCARSPAALNHLLACKATGRRRAGSRPNSRPTSRPNSRPSSRPSSRPGSAAGNEQTISLQVPPDETSIQVRIALNETVEDLLWKALADRPLHPPDFFIRCRSSDGEVHIPARGELLQQLIAQYEQFEVCAKGFYQVELMRPSLDQLFGFSVEAELVEPAAGTQAAPGSPLPELCVYVSRVETNSAAEQQQLGRADEILVINGALVSELDMMYIESVLQEELGLCMMLRTSRPVQGAASAPLFASFDLPPDEYIESLVCPPPPPDNHMSDEMIGRLIAPPPAPTNQLLPQQCSIDTQVTSVSELCDPPWLPTAQPSSTAPAAGITSGCTPSPTPPPPPPPTQLTALGSEDSNEHVQPLLLSPLPPPPQADSFDFDPTQSVLSDTDRLKKVIDELLQTEQAYVQHLDDLLHTYLQPLQQQQDSAGHCSPSNMNIEAGNAPFACLHELIKWQQSFLLNLRACISDRVQQFSSQSQFASVLLSLADLFIDSADHFKQYSAFCAAHAHALRSGGSLAVLNQRSLNNSSGSQESLGSLLIRPVQRVLRYPLLLQQLRSAANAQSVEQERLGEALAAMENVAGHMNEMQRVHDEFGAIFEHLTRQQAKGNRWPVAHLSTVDLLHYGTVTWTNAAEFLGKLKKGVDLHALCFVFRSAVVFLCKERIRQKKRLVTTPNKSNEVEIIRYQTLMPVSEVQVRATGNKGEHVQFATEFSWELIHLKTASTTSGSQRRTEKLYQLSNTTSEERNSFLRHIRQIIRQSVANMPLPVTRSSRSGSGGTLQVGALQALASATFSTGTGPAQLESPSGSSSAADPHLLDVQRRPATKATGRSGPAPRPAGSGQRLHNNRTIEKQRTIEEKSSPPMWLQKESEREREQERDRERDHSNYDRK